MVLLLGETIGFQELLVIGILALIFFGPRKLPEMARTIGKYMAEFRKATQEFKSTWEEEVSAIKKDIKDDMGEDGDHDTRLLAFLENPKPVQSSIGGNGAAAAVELAEKPAGQNGNSAVSNSGNGNEIKQLEAPTVKQVDAQQFKSLEAVSETSALKEPAVKTKKDWL